MPSTAAPPLARTTPRGAEAGRSLLAVAATAVLIIGCVVAGRWLTATGHHLYLGRTYPVVGRYRLHLTGWLLAPVALGAVLLGPAWRLAGTLAWRKLLGGSFLAAAAWAVALAVVSGPAAVAAPLRSPYEYLHEVARIRGMGLDAFWRTFPDYVASEAHGPLWTVQVAGHPPLATLVFVLLASLGLGGPGWAAALCIAGGAAAVPAVLCTVGLLADEPTARAAAPFVAAAPAALWIATSADALFAGVAAAGICALAHAAARRDWRGDLLALAAGVLLGACLYLSYGLVLLAPLAGAVLIPQRRIRPLMMAAAGVAIVVAGSTLAGFWWLDGLTATVQRMKGGGGYYERPNAYFIFANPAALAVVLGPAVVGAAALVRGGWSRRRDLLLVPTAVMVALVTAMISNLSKGEVERIWLPWAVWLLPVAALIRTNRRAWFAAQLGWAALIAMCTQLEW